MLPNPAEYGRRLTSPNPTHAFLTPGAIHAVALRSHERVPDRTASPQPPFTCHTCEPCSRVCRWVRVCGEPCARVCWWVRVCYRVRVSPPHRLSSLSLPPAALPFFSGRLLAARLPAVAVGRNLARPPPRRALQPPPVGTHLSRPAATPRLPFRPSARLVGSGGFDQPLPARLRAAAIRSPPARLRRAGRRRTTRRVPAGRRPIFGDGPDAATQRVGGAARLLLPKHGRRLFSAEPVRGLGADRWVSGGPGCLGPEETPCLGLWLGRRWLDRGKGRREPVKIITPARTAPPPALRSAAVRPYLAPQSPPLQPPPPSSDFALFRRVIPSPCRDILSHSKPHAPCGERDAAMSQPHTGARRNPRLCRPLRRPTNRCRARNRRLSTRGRK